MLITPGLYFSDMKKNGIFQSLLKHQFRRDRADDGRPFGLYSRVFPIISTVVYFNHSTGELYAIRFPNDEQMELRIAGESENIVLERLDLLASINVQQIVKPSDFERAITFFEFQVDTKMMEISSYQPFNVGERVICWHEKFGYNVGRTKGYVSAGIVIETEGKDLVLPVHCVARVKNKIVVTSGLPGTWDLLSEVTLERIALARKRFLKV